MTPETPRITIDTRLQQWLDLHAPEHEVHEHPTSYTALSTARLEGVDPRTFAKVVAVEADEGGPALIVLDAVDHLDLNKAKEVLGAPVRLLQEPQIAELIPDWEVGTAPPIPELCGMRVLADEAVRADERLSFHAGSHRAAIRLDRVAWEEAAGIVYADLARRG